VESNPHQDQESQKRRSTRIVQSVPLTVTGVDALGRPFQERTSTLIINCHGCRYQSKHYVLKNMWVTFEVPHNEAGHEPRSVRARVTWIQRPRTVRELFQIGVELEVPGNVWGIAFPPGDWFPFPESDSNLGGMLPASESPENMSLDVSDWSAEEPPTGEPPETVEDNLRVLPLPGGSNASQQLARQMARLVIEAKQQVQGAVRESATHAVAAETRPLLAALQTQLQDAAEKSVAAAVAAHMERTQRDARQLLENERDSSVAAMRVEWSRELDRRISEARAQIDTKLAEVESLRRADFEQQIQGQLQVAIEKLHRLTDGMGANAGEVRTAIEQIQKDSAEAIENETRRWQEQMNERSSEAQARLAHLEQAAKHLSDQISNATSAAESGWRGFLEADLAAASTRWNKKIDESIETSIENAARRTAERLSRSGEDAAQRIEQQLQQRISGISSELSQMTAQAENALGSLRASIDTEAARGKAAISQMQQSVEQLEARRGEFHALLQAASEEWARRGQAMLDAQSGEMNRRAESALAGMAQRLQPVLDAAGRDTIERLASELEQRLSPQISQATEMLSKFALEREQTEKSLTEHQQRVWQASELSVQDAVARGKELLAQVEKEFGESSRAASAKWLSELETKATETTHSTFETLFKSADWYEKKVQTQMQATLEKGLEQAFSGMREKAGELSGLFASELDHYSRSYVEHSKSQMQDNAREAAEQAGQEMTNAAESSATSFIERATQLGREQFDLYAAKTNIASEQSIAHLEAHTVQVRSKLESDSRTFAAEYQHALAQQSQQNLTQAREELAAEINQAKDSLRLEAQTLDSHFQTSMQSLSAQAMDEHKRRLENASNTWLFTSVIKLNQQSESLIDQLAAATEKRLQTVCGSVFAEMGETLRQRLAGLSAPMGTPKTPAAPAPSSDSSEEQK